MGEIWRDFVLGCRVLRRNPVVTVTAVVTLGLGIGGTTAVFSVADGVLFRPLSYPEPDRLVRVSADLAYDDFRALQRESRTLGSMALFRGVSVGVTGVDEPERIRGEYVTASYFDVLDADPALGRLIRPDESVPGGDLTLVLAHGYWQRRFGSDPSVLGRSINLNDVPHTIVGVMPPGFRSHWDDTEAWITPQTMPYGGLSEESRGYFGMIARLADGTDLPAAEREIDRAVARWAEAGVHPGLERPERANVQPLAASIVTDELAALVWWLLGAVGIVLLIATANVAGLQLARASERSREMAVRAALGGGRGRLLRQLLIESLTLAAVGGAVGIGVAHLTLRVLEADGITPFLGFDIELNLLALGVAALLTLGAGTLAGLFPALRQSATQPASGLRMDTRSGSGRESTRFRSRLVVAQIGMAVTLLVSACLLLRSAAAINGLELGYDTEHVLTGETRLTADMYRDEGNRRVYLERLVERLAEIPGVRGSTLIKGMPFAGDDDFLRVREQGSALDWEQVRWVNAPPVAEGYFEFMGIPLVAGRTFQRLDGPDAERVVVISRNLAERLFLGADAVGRTVETPDGAARVIGVVENTREVQTEFQEAAYVHYLQAPPSFFSVLIRTETEAEDFTRALLEAFWSVDPNQPLWEVTTLEERMANNHRRPSFFSVILGGFAALALLLAAVGLYGVMAHSVSARERELGVRMALGAGPTGILRMMLRQGADMVALGLVIGTAAATAVARLLASLLFGITPFDAVSFAVAPVVLLAVAALATYLPARRATRVDPVEAIRG